MEHIKDNFFVNLEEIVKISVQFVLTLNKWSASRHRKTRNDFLMDTSRALRTYIVNQLGEISISEALYP